MPILKKTREIRDSNGNLVFERFAVFESRFFSIYKHNLHRADRDEHPHNHPWNMVVFILSGGYREELVVDGQTTERVCRPGFPKFYNRFSFHRVKTLLAGKSVSFVLCLGRRRMWGYLVDGAVLPNKLYRDYKEYKKTMEREGV